MIILIAFIGSMLLYHGHMLEGTIILSACAIACGLASIGEK